jgi:biopolymer transport protein TolR
MSRYRRRSKNHKRPMAEMNIVPYIDVMLVLLVIFMTTSPLLDLQGIEIDLPESSESKSPPIETKPPIIVSVNSYGDYFVTDGSINEQFTLDTLKLRIKTLLSQKGQQERYVLLRGDTNIAYGEVIKLLDILKSLDIPKLSIITKPKNL